jgi:hypothetical protein
MELCGFRNPPLAPNIIDNLKASEQDSGRLIPRNSQRTSNHATPPGFCEVMMLKVEMPLSYASHVAHQANNL